MPGHSRSKNGVASLAFVPGIHVLNSRKDKNVDGRDKPGHDELLIPSKRNLLQFAATVISRPCARQPAHGSSIAGSSDFSKRTSRQSLGSAAKV